MIWRTLTDLFRNGGEDAPHQSPVTSLYPTAKSSTLNRRTRRRLHIAAEILQTERSYLDSLNQVHDLFYEPILKSLKSAEDGGPLVRNKKVFTAIFSNLQDIRAVNDELLRQLVERLGVGGEVPVDHHAIESHWSPYAGRLGDVFLALSPFLKMYSIYTRNFNLALQVFNQELRNNERFRKFIETQYRTPALKCLPLPSYLIMPVQRIPRYKLLLSELVRYTSMSHPDYDNLKLAAHKIESLAQFVNDEIRKHDNLLMMIDIQQRMIGFKDVNGGSNLVTTQRKLLKKGVVMKVCTKDHQQRVLMLFNDILVVAKMRKNYASHLTSFLGYTDENGLLPDGLPFLDKDRDFVFLFRGCFALDKIRIQDITNDHEDENNDANSNLCLPVLSVLPHTFLILSKDRSFQLFCTSAEEKTEWLDAFQSAMDNLVQDQQNPLHISTGYSPSPSRCESPVDSEEESYCAPIWVPDSAASECFVCSSEFTLIRRRHHCRKCGRVVCGACSTKSFVVPAYPIERVERACDPCYYEMFKVELERHQEKGAENTRPQLDSADTQNRNRSTSSTNSRFLLSDNDACAASRPRFHSSSSSVAVDRISVEYVSSNDQKRSSTNGQFTPANSVTIPSKMNEPTHRSWNVETARSLISSLIFNSNEDEMAKELFDPPPLSSTPMERNRPIPVVNRFSAAATPVLSPIESLDVRQYSRSVSSLSMVLSRENVRRSIGDDILALGRPKSVASQASISTNPSRDDSLFKSPLPPTKSQNQTQNQNLADRDDSVSCRSSRNSLPPTTRFRSITTDERYETLTIQPSNTSENTTQTSDLCHLCHEMFGILRWRYQCHNCKRTVCSQCATRTVPGSKSIHRFCDLCYFTVYTRDQKNAHDDRSSQSLLGFSSSAGDRTKPLAVRVGSPVPFHYTPSQRSNSHQPTSHDGVRDRSRTMVVSLPEIEQPVRDRSITVAADTHSLEEQLASRFLSFGY